MSLHSPACPSLNAHILAVRDEPQADELDVSVLIRLAVAEYDREHGVEAIDPIDAYKRMRDLGWSESEFRVADGNR